jgi:hypothetical protein
MNDNHAAFWSPSPSQEERRYRTTHHNRTKRRGDRQRQQEQRKEEWTWDDVLDGKGCYTWEEILAGKDRLPWEQVEAARREEPAIRGNTAGKEARESAAKKILGGHTGSIAKPSRRPAPTSCAYRRARETGHTMLLEMLSGS